MAGRNFHDVHKERQWPILRDVTLRNKSPKEFGPNEVPDPRKPHQRSDFRGERESICGGGVVEWFHPETVACQEPLPFAGGGNGECEHAVQFRQRLISPRFISVEYYFCVGLRRKLMSEDLQLSAEILVIVDFSIVHNHHIRVPASHGLKPANAIDNTQSSSADCPMGKFLPISLIRASMTEQMG